MKSRSTSGASKVEAPSCRTKLGYIRAGAGVRRYYSGVARDTDKLARSSYRRVSGDRGRGTAATETQGGRAVDRGKIEERQGNIVTSGDALLVWLALNLVVPSTRPKPHFFVIYDVQMKDQW